MLSFPKVNSTSFFFHIFVNSCHNAIAFSSSNNPFNYGVYAALSYAVRTKVLECKLTRGQSCDLLNITI